MYKKVKDDLQNSIKVKVSVLNKYMHVTYISESVLVVKNFIIRNCFHFFNPFLFLRDDFEHLFPCFLIYKTDQDVPHLRYGPQRDTWLAKMAVPLR